MAYRKEKNSGGKSDLVIDGFQNGIAPSPYSGIGNMQGVNSSYYPGSAYVNYKRTATSSSAIWYAGANSTNVSNNSGWVFGALGSGTGSIMTDIRYKAVSPNGLVYFLDTSGTVWKQDTVNSGAFSQLGNGSGRLGNGSTGLAYFNNYLVVFGGGFIEFCGDGTGDAGIVPANWNISSGSGSVMSTFTVTAASTTLTRSTATAVFFENDPVTFTSTGILPAPIVPNTTYYVTSVTGLDLTISTTLGGSNITFTDVGSGVHTIYNQSDFLPLGNCTNLTFTTTLFPDDTSATISSYTSPTGQSILEFWQGATGQYMITSSNGNKILSNFTKGSGVVTFLAPIIFRETGTFTITLIENVTTNKAYVSKVDGNLYFANGRSVGRILSQNENTVFNPSAYQTYIAEHSATQLLQTSDEVVDLLDLYNTLILAGKKDIYPWDYVSPSPGASSPVGETIVRLENVLGSIFITAGQKGNIYSSNGYSVQLFTKIPDYIAGVIDPVWVFGDSMAKRSKLFFQVLAQTPAGTNIFAGVFSLIVSPAAINDASTGIMIEGQNSYGLTPASGSSALGALVEDSPSSTGYDSYYSAWSNGSNIGGIDYNTTALWQNYEPFIETDIIPIGTIMDKMTLGNIEFKLDRPMASGDQLRMYWRPSLSDSFQLIGTTSTTQISEYYPTKISQSQWAQFRIEYKCAPTGSSYIPLREVRIHES